MNRRQLFKRLPRHFNTIAFTWEHFEHFCKLDSIRVIEADLAGDRGRFTYYREQPIIFLDDSLRGADRVFVALHELGHFWLHEPGYYQFSSSAEKAEIEADIVAACGMIPLGVLLTRLPEEIAEDLNCPMELVELRMRLFRKYGV